ncbi:RHS repeat-associated core domain-containing protein, partial [Pseudoxanthomonas sp.]|uniref:RHS repeat-associated core domain-containing protein n=1 Tax=Pseudoxanthomonas sp. TaxID=1871049 RepID=UPI003F80314A
KSLLFPDSKGNQTWYYWPTGAVQTIVTDNDGPATGTVTNHYSYNKRGLLTGESVTQSGWYSWGIQYRYDGLGNRSGYTTPDQLNVNYSLNALGQPLSVTSGWGTHASGISYYPNGAIKQFTYGNGIVHTMDQNARQLPIRTVDGAVQNLVYSYDHNGNVEAIGDYVQGGGDGSHSRWMTYDGLDRLTSVGSCMFGGDCWHRFTYNALDNLTSWKLAGVKDYAAYVYDATNRLIGIQNSVAATVVGLSYDPQGNLENKNGQAYHFDYGNRLREVVGKESYRYDGYGRRLSARSATDGDILSMYGQDGQLVFRQDWRRNLSLPHIYLGNSLLATIEWNFVTNTGELRYQHTDALGSPTVVTNASGQVVERNNYEPYGSVIGKPNYGGIGFTGHVQDAATGLTYMQQRYYDPTIGRFLSVDPVTAYSNPVGAFNRYWYANNSPYKFTDPDGRQVVCDENRCSGTVRNHLDELYVLAVYASRIIENAIVNTVTQPGLQVPEEAIRELAQTNQNESEGNTNPYTGPVDKPVIVVDGDGNAIPVGEGEQVSSSPDGRYQQVRDRDGSPTGTRLDKGGHKGQSDPQAQGPHGHRPGVTDENGNPHLPINEPKLPPLEQKPQ